MIREFGHSTRGNAKPAECYEDEKKDDFIAGEELELSAPLFCDCTGDGSIGFLSGADWKMGREGRDEFGESLAPLKGDKLTMGASVQWYSVETDKKTTFHHFNPNSFRQNIHSERRSGPEYCHGAERTEISR